MGLTAALTIISTVLAEAPSAIQLVTAIVNGDQATIDQLIADDAAMAAAVAKIQATLKNAT